MPDEEERKGPWVGCLSLGDRCVCFRAPLIELYQGGPDCGLGLKQDMTQEPYEASKAQPFPTTGVVREQGQADQQAGTHKQVMTQQVVNKQF